MNRWSKYVLIGIGLVLVLLGGYVWYSKATLDDVDNVAELPAKKQNKTEQLSDEYNYRQNLDVSFNDEQVDRMDDIRDPFELDSYLRSFIDSDLNNREVASEDGSVEEGLDDVESVQEEDKDAVEDSVVVEESDEEEVSKSDKITKEQVDAVLESLEGRYSFDRDMVHALISTVSGYDKDKIVDGVSGTESRGIMMINEKTAESVSNSLGFDYKDGDEFLYDRNIMMGVYYLDYLSNINKDKHYVLTAYVLGPKGADSWREKSGSYESSFSREVLDKLK